MKKIDEYEGIYAKFESIKDEYSFIKKLEKDEGKISEFTISFIKRK